MPGTEHKNANRYFTAELIKSLPWPNVSIDLSWTCNGLNHYPFTQNPHHDTFPRFSAPTLSPQILTIVLSALTVLFCCGSAVTNIHQNLPLLKVSSLQVFHFPTLSLGKFFCSFTISLKTTKEGKAEAGNSLSHFDCQIPRKKKISHWRKGLLKHLKRTFQKEGNSDCICTLNRKCLAYTTVV